MATCETPDFHVRKTFLQCVFCDRQEHVLKLLVCNHSACVQCLKLQLSHNVRCSRCHAVTDIKGGLEGLPENFLQRAADVINRLVEDTPCAYCQGQGKKTVSTCVCIDCQGEAFCQDCIKVHRSLKVTRTHISASILELVNKSELREQLFRSRLQPECPKHNMNSAILCQFCQDCSVSICRLCSLEEHNEHRCCPLDKLARARVHDMKEHMRRLSVSNVHKAVTDMEKELSNIIGERDQIINKIQQKIDEVITTIKSRGQQQIDDICLFYSLQMAEHEKKLYRVHNLQSKFNNAMLLVEMYNTMSSDSDSVEQYDMILTRLQGAQKYGTEAVDENINRISIVDMEHAPEGGMRSTVSGNSGEGHTSLIHEIPLLTKDISLPTVISLQIIIKTSGRKFFNIEVKCSDCISSVKAKIQHLEGIPQVEQSLLFAGKDLDDECTINECNIRNFSVLSLVRCLPNFQIFVKTSSEKTVTLDVKPSDSVESLKARLRAKGEVLTDQHCLMYKSKQLENGHSLRYYSITQHSNLYFDQLPVVAPCDMQIFVKNTNTEGRATTFRFQPGDSIRDVKEIIQKKLEIPVQRQELVCNGTLLQEERTLRECGVERGSTLHLV